MIDILTEAIMAGDMTPPPPPPELPDKPEPLFPPPVKKVKKPLTEKQLAAKKAKINARARVARKKKARLLKRGVKI
jgi:hypothetical protein